MNLTHLKGTDQAVRAYCHELLASSPADCFQLDQVLLSHLHEHAHSQQHSQVLSRYLMCCGTPKKVADHLLA